MTKWVVGVMFINPWSKDRVRHTIRELPDTAAIVEAFEEIEKNLGKTFDEDVQTDPRQLSLYVYSSAAAETTSVPCWFRFMCQEAGPTLAVFLQVVSEVNTYDSPHVIIMHIFPKSESDKRLAAFGGSLSDRSRRFTLPKIVEARNVKTVRLSPSNNLKVSGGPSSSSKVPPSPAKNTATNHTAGLTVTQAQYPNQTVEAGSFLDKKPVNKSVAITSAHDKSIYDDTADGSTPVTHLFKIYRPYTQSLLLEIPVNINFLPTVEEVQCKAFVALREADWPGMTEDTFNKRYVLVVGQMSNNRSTYEAWRNHQIKGKSTTSATNAPTEVSIIFLLRQGSTPKSGTGLGMDSHTSNSDNSPAHIPAMTLGRSTLGRPYDQSYIEAQDRKIHRTVSRINPTTSSKSEHSAPLCGHATPQKECWRCHMNPIFHPGSPPSCPAGRGQNSSSESPSPQSQPATEVRTNNIAHSSAPWTDRSAKSTEEQRWAYYKQSSTLTAGPSQPVGSQQVKEQTYGADAASSQPEVQKVNEAIKAHAAPDSVCLAVKSAAAVPELPDTTSGGSPHVDDQSVKSSQESVSRSPKNMPSSDSNSELDTASSPSACSDEGFVHVTSSGGSQPLQRGSTRDYFDELIAAPDNSPTSINLLRIMQEEQVSPASSLGLKLLDFTKELQKTPKFAGSKTCTMDDTHQSIISALAEDRKAAESRMDEMATMLKQIAIKVGVDSEEEQKLSSRQETIDANESAESRGDKTPKEVESERMMKFAGEVGEELDRTLSMLKVPTSNGISTEEEPSPEAPVPKKEQAQPVLLKDDDSDSECATPKVSFSDLMSSSRQVINSVNAIHSPYQSRGPLPSPSPFASPKHLLERLMQRSEQLADAVKEPKVAEPAGEAVQQQLESPEPSIQHLHSGAATQASRPSLDIDGIHRSMNPQVSSEPYHVRFHPYNTFTMLASPLDNDPADPKAFPSGSFSHAGHAYPMNAWFQPSTSTPAAYSSYGQVEVSNAASTDQPTPYEGYRYHPYWVNEAQQRMMSTPAHYQAHRSPVEQYMNGHGYHWPAFPHQLGQQAFVQPLSHGYAYGPSHETYPTAMAAHQHQWGQQLPNVSPTVHQRPFW
ncbi:hypothetical protein IAT40_003991 [Kwoniella sp. CBS 6097]